MCILYTRLIKLETHTHTCPYITQVCLVYSLQGWVGSVMLLFIETPRSFLSRQQPPFLFLLWPTKMKNEVNPPSHVPRLEKAFVSNRTAGKRLWIPRTTFSWNISPQNMIQLSRWYLGILTPFFFFFFFSSTKLPSSYSFEWKFGLLCSLWNMHMQMSLLRGGSFAGERKGVLQRAERVFFPGSVWVNVNWSRERNPQRCSRRSGRKLQNSRQKGKSTHLNNTTHQR